jgi:hypothetical protein
MASLSRHEVNKYIQIFKDDINFNKFVLEEEGISFSDEKYRELVLLLLEHKNIINDSTIDELSAQRPPYLRLEIASLFGKDFIKAFSYRQIMYTFKYSTLKTFFRDNWKVFVPDFDVLNIVSSDQKRIFQEALMSEFDKFAEIIDEIYNIQDVDRVPDKYLSYLAQSIGYEREDSDFLYDASFRELIKNIIEIYRIKGTNFSFELFFSFLGFDAEIREFWFDKRFADPGVINNPFTNLTDKASFQFYLSTIRPTEYIPDGMNEPYSVNENQITETMDGNEFNYLSGAGLYTPRELMGLEPSDWEEPYEFFKTNVIQFNLTRFDADEVADVGVDGSNDGGLSAEDLEIIRIYANFLTPIFVQKSVVIITRPFVDDATSLIFTDFSRRDLRAINEVIDKETMFHMYSGRQPSSYYWEDGTRYHSDPIPNSSYPRWSGKSIEPGGHFISGYFNDTYKKVFDPTEPTSIYSILQSANPDWKQKEIFQEINNLLSNGTLFTNYNIFDRDLLQSLIDDKFFYPFISKLIQDDFSVGTYRKFSSKERMGKSYYDSYNKKSLYENPEYAPNRYNRAKIQSITANNGNGQAELIINDQRKLFCNFKDFDKVQFEDRLLGDFVKGDNIVRNIEYNYETAPYWTPKYYYVGDFVRDPGDDNVLVCNEEHDASANINISAQFFKWSNASGIDNLSVGLIFKLPESLFDYEILRINKINKTVTLNKPIPKNATEKTFKVYNIHHNFIEIKSSLNTLNDGIYNVQGSESFKDNGLNYTKLTLSNVLKKDQNSPGGFMFLNFPQRKMHERIPFLFNEIDIEREFIGDSETSHKDDINHLMPLHFELYNKNSQLNALEPYPDGTLGADYSDWPRGGIFQTTNILGEDYPTLFDNPEDLQDEDNVSLFRKMQMFFIEAFIHFDETLQQHETIFTNENLFEEYLEKFFKDINIFSKEFFVFPEEYSSNLFQETTPVQNYSYEEQNTFYKVAEAQYPISGVELLENKYTRVSSTYYWLSSMNKYYFDYLEMRAKTRFEDNVYSIGDTGPAGGTIFYINPNEEDDWTYIEVAPESIETFLEWKAGGVSEARNSVIGAGKTNTEAIVAAKGSGNYAAYYCYDLTYYNPVEDYFFSDWYLPSRNELAEINNVVSTDGLDSGVYWSSTEASLFNAYTRDLNNNTDTSLSKENQYLVRPIRYF